MRTKIKINELYESIKDYFNLNELELLDISKKNMKQEIDNLTKDNVITCNNNYSVIFDTEALYVEFFDDLIKIPFNNGEQIINCLSKVLIEYVTIDTELPIIKDIFKYKEVRKKTKSR